MVTVTKKPDQATPTDPGDHVESLESIAKLGEVLEAPPPPDGQVVKSDQDEAREIVTALAVLRAAAVPFAPDHVQQPLMTVWSDPQLKAIADAIIELCKLHGWTVGDFFGVYGPYIQLAMALGMPLLVTIKLLKTPPPKVADGQQQPA